MVLGTLQTMQGSFGSRSQQAAPERLCEPACGPSNVGVLLSPPAAAVCAAHVRPALLPGCMAVAVVDAVQGAAASGSMPSALVLVLGCSAAPPGTPTL
jgi:hypothetical protein